MQTEHSGRQSLTDEEEEEEAERQVSRQSPLGSRFVARISLMVAEAHNHRAHEAHC